MTSAQWLGLVIAIWGAAGMWVAGKKVLLVVNGVSVLVWLVMLPLPLLTGLKRSLPFLVFLSVWALEAAALAGVVAGMAALRAEQDRER